MAKWADYCVSAVRYDDEGNHIDHLKVHRDLGDKLSVGDTWLT